VWIVGRFIYMQAYLAEPAKRSTGFSITILASAALLILSVIGVVMALMTVTAA
jgi:glutathione S-transferase